MRQESRKALRVVFFSKNHYREHFFFYPKISFTNELSGFQGEQSVYMMGQRASVTVKTQREEIKAGLAELEKDVGSLFGC